MVLEKEGSHHRLVLPTAQPPDGGEFQCVAGDERAYFTVTITGGGPGRPVGQRPGSCHALTPGPLSPGPASLPPADPMSLLGLHPEVQSPTENVLSLTLARATQFTGKLCPLGSPAKGSFRNGSRAGSRAGTLEGSEDLKSLWETLAPSGHPTLLSLVPPFIPSLSQPSEHSTFL